MPIDEKMVKFEQLAAKRTEKVLHSIALLANLSNTNVYHYKPEHVQQIFGAIDDAVSQVKQQFEPKATVEQAFSFSGISHEISEEEAAKETDDMSEDLEDGEDEDAVH